MRKNERITILGTADFKAFLVAEAEREGVSVSELVRRRCMAAPAAPKIEGNAAAALRDLENRVKKLEARFQPGS